MGSCLVWKSLTVPGQRAAGRLQAEVQTQKTAVRSLKGEGKPHLQSQKLLLTVKLGDIHSFSHKSKPNFREVETHVPSHTASKWWLLDLGLDLDHLKASRLRLLVWSFYLHPMHCFSDFPVCKSHPNRLLRMPILRPHSWVLIQRVQSGAQVLVVFYF